MRGPLGRFTGRRTASAAVVVAVVAAPLLGVALAGEGNPVAELELSNGSAWVASPEQGLVTLVDGASERVAASVRVPGGPALTVVQAGASAYVADPGAGTVARVDGTTFEVGAPVRFAEPGGGVAVLQGGPEVFVVDVARRTASRVDPDALLVREELSMAASPGPGQAVVDDEGRLWVVDQDGGGLTWFDGDKHVDPDVAGARSRVVLVRGRAVLVDLDGARLAPLSDAGRAGPWSCLEVRPDDDVQLLGSRTREEVFAAVSGTGTVVVASVGEDGCGRVVPVAPPGVNDFGPLVQSDRFVFVPNRTTGRTSVVDTRDLSVAATFDLGVPGSRVELVSEDGLVFYNDLDGATTGVLTLRAGVWERSEALEKYDPTTGAPAAVRTPAQGPASPGDAAPAPAAPPPTAEATAPAPQPSPTAPAPTAAPTAPPTAGPSPPPAPAPAQADGTRPGRPGTGAPGPAAPGDRVAAVVPPALDALTATPPVIGVDGTTTLTATLANAQRSRWQVTVRASACDYALTTASEPVPAEQVRSGAFEAPLGPLDSTCLGTHTVELLLTGESGSVSRQVAIEIVADPAGTPVVDTLACTPEHPGPADALTCSATESVVGARATWTWAVTDLASGAEVAAPTRRAAGEPFVTSLAAPSAYQVSLTVSHKGITATRTVDVTSSVAVPDVVGSTVDGAQAVLAEVGLAADLVHTRSNAAPAGTVLACDPAAGTAVVVGDTVRLTVSAGPNDPVDLLALAPAAAWRSGAGTLPWSGADTDARGFALVRPRTLRVEDGSAPTLLETHPEWVAGGWIEGRFTLPQPVLAGDRFRATIGFLAVASPPSAGVATFEVRAVLPGGGTSGALARVTDTGADGVLRSLDLDLSGVAGATGIVLRVEAGDTPAQDWAVWVAPRVEG